MHLENKIISAYTNEEGYTKRERYTKEEGTLETEGSFLFLQKNADMTKKCYGLLNFSTRKEMEELL